MRAKKDSLQTGPGAAKHMVRSAPGSYQGYTDLEQLHDVIESVQSPDFSELYTQFYTMRVELPDDPLAIGLPEMASIIKTIPDFYRELVNLRLEALALKTEWESTRKYYNQLVESKRREARSHQDYVQCKNSESRRDFEDAYVGVRYLGMENEIEVSIQRISSFLDACYLKSKEIEMWMEAANMQMNILRMEMELNPKQ